MLMLPGQVGSGCRAVCREQGVFLGDRTAQAHNYSTEKSKTFLLSGDPSLPLVSKGRWPRECFLHSVTGDGPQGQGRHGNHSHSQSSSCLLFERISRTHHLDTSQQPCAIIGPIS